MKVLLLVCSVLAMTRTANARYIMYLTGQHNIVPEFSLVEDITHVAIAFMQSSVFNQQSPKSWPFFTTVEDVRSRFAPGTAIMVAIGGWGDTAGFSEAAKSGESRKLFAKNVKDMVDATGADGVDIDWEYPGGSGEDYKSIPNPEKAWEIEAYPSLLAEIRQALGPDKLISAAVPGIPRDMLAFTSTTIPLISTSVDFLNIMTYDLMNRRDNVTRHHTGLALSLASVDAYLEAGLDPQKANLGFAFYVKWFKTDPSADCGSHLPNCKTTLMEDPETGADLGQAGAFSWHDEVPNELKESFAKALKGGVYDEEGGGHYFWDEKENLFWSWDTPKAISLKFPAIVEERGLGGVFAWGLGEDGLKWGHLKATTAGYRAWKAKHNLPSSAESDSDLNHIEKDEL
ncbi:glycoside hydrolase [Mollisia scopiformis]|uniref:chitinase n=1 Tax=Mollisia scopiformis TaxID=149040 RepID=A0A194XIS8_MOLSC|nr:glycoside hydrolase [Mollisia scopiformis]KUJ20024.1 glycoside hydrolase [Mollisia scopiformis]